MGEGHIAAMNRAELVEVIQKSFELRPPKFSGGKQHYPLTKRQISQVIDAMQGAIASTLKIGGTVDIENFGSIYRIISKPRSGRNPRTGTAILIASKKRIRFRASCHRSA